MTHEKIFFRPDGSKVKIVASLSIGYFTGDAAKWDYFVLSCEPKKRIWRGVVDEDDYAYRALSMADRKKKSEAGYLKFVTKEEVLSAKMELWEKLKPIL